MNKSHLIIETPDANPRGGQRVGSINRGVRVTHKPTGIIAFCDTERSQIRNRDIAFAMIEYGLAEINWVENGKAES